MSEEPLDLEWLQNEIAALIPWGEVGRRDKVIAAMTRLRLLVLEMKIKVEHLERSMAEEESR